ncbi:hypothetical protein ACVWWO_002602 [Bradyrhizobium sp. F1.13.1]
MRAEEGCADRDRPLTAEASRGGQLPHLGLGIQAVAGLDLDRGGTLGNQRIEPRQRVCYELGLACLARRGHCRDDTAAGARDLLVARALQAQLEFMGAVAAIDQMGVTIDETGRDPAPSAIDPFGCIGIRRKISLRTCIDDMAGARGDHAMLDLTKIGAVGPHRGEPGVMPDPVEALCHATVPSRMPLRPGMLDLYV